MSRAPARASGPVLRQAATSAATATAPATAKSILAVFMTPPSGYRPDGPQNVDFRAEDAPFARRRQDARAQEIDRTSNVAIRGRPRAAGDLLGGAGQVFVRL